jgi:hypothetical protein
MTLFSLQTFYNIECYRAQQISDALKKNKNIRIIPSICDIILEYIICPKCRCLYQDSMCYCWFVETQYIEIIFILDLEDSEEDIDVVNDHVA